MIMRGNKKHEPTRPQTEFNYFAGFSTCSSARQEPRHHARPSLRPTASVNVNTPRVTALGGFAAVIGGSAL